MNPDALAERLAEHGLDPGDTARTHDLFATVVQSFDALTGKPADYAWWVPGRLEVFGRHTDYCGGHSLVGTIPRGFVFLARSRHDRLVRLVDARRGEELQIGAQSPSMLDIDRLEVEQGAVRGWRRYAHVIVRRLMRNFPGASIGADVVFASDLPSASGMSSSSALVVGLVTALVEAGRLQERHEWLENVKRPEDAAGYYACFENGLSFGSLDGDGGVGTHGGSEDHVAIVCGRASHLSAWQFVPIRHCSVVQVPEAWTFAIASSGVAAQKIGAAMEQYNSLSRRARTLLEIWNRVETPQPSLFAALTSMTNAPDRLRALARDNAWSPGLEARLEQFVREDRRVIDAIEAIRAGDRACLGDLSEASQHEAESLLGNQVAETIALTRSARDLGAFAASSFGAGFGGSVWALVDREDAQHFAGRWLADYRARFAFRSAATTFVSRPGPGLTRVA